jgi:hypothetical protein
MVAILALSVTVTQGRQTATADPETCYAAEATFRQDERGYQGTCEPNAPGFDSSLPNLARYPALRDSWADNGAVYVRCGLLSEDQAQQRIDRCREAERGIADFVRSEDESVAAADRDIKGQLAALQDGYSTASAASAASAAAIAATVRRVDRRAAALRRLVTLPYLRQVATPSLSGLHGRMASYSDRLAAMEEMAMLSRRCPPGRSTGQLAKKARKLSQRYFAGRKVEIKQVVLDSSRPHRSDDDTDDDADDDTDDDLNEDSDSDNSDHDNPPSSRTQVVTGYVCYQETFVDRDAVCAFEKLQLRRKQSRRGRWGPWRMQAPMHSAVQLRCRNLK